MSNPDQAGPGRAKLDERKHDLYHTVRKMAPGNPVVFIAAGVEKGYADADRPCLDRLVGHAARRAARRPGTVTIAVTWEATRFIRSRENRDGVPTTAEFVRLEERTPGLVLATVVDPAATEWERRSQRIRLSGRAGRPRTGDELAGRIARDLGRLSRTADGTGWRWETPIGVVARRYGVGKATVERVLDRMPPGGSCTYMEIAVREYVSVLRRRTGYGSVASPGDY